MKEGESKEGGYKQRVALQHSTRQLQRTCAALSCLVATAAVSSFLLLTSQATIRPASGADARVLFISA